MKKLLMLGGSLYQIYAIKEAVKLGYYVISCDYLPNNPGHMYAHEYHNVSTTDKDAVLKLAKSLKVDGIVAYASDPAAPTAAFVCEHLHLPTNPYKSVEILSRKDLFRSFLKENGFNTPKAQGFQTYEEALAVIDTFKLPVMVKPVDSSGSKGINKLTNKSQLSKFVTDALNYSKAKRFIIEEFIIKKGYQISGDAFSIDGKLVFHYFGNEYYSSKVSKKFAPLGEFWPSLMDNSIISHLCTDIQRLISLLGMKSSAYNIEAIVDENNDIYILEVGARSGGSLIPQITEYATGINLVTYVIKAAMGDDCSNLKMQPGIGYWSNYMVHAKKTGRYAGIKFNESFLKNNLIDFVTDFKIGDPVHQFRDAQDAIGTLIIKYKDIQQMIKIVENMDQYVSVLVK